MKPRTNIVITSKDVARAMRGIRVSKGLPQKAVASALHISQSTLSKIERGVLEPTAVQWMSFCLLTGEPMDIVLMHKLEGSPNA